MPGLHLSDATAIVAFLALIGGYFAWRYIRPGENRVNNRIGEVEKKFTDTIGGLQEEIHKFRDDLRAEIQTNREAAIVRDSDLSRLLATNQAVLESVKQSVDRQTATAEKSDAALLRFADNIGQFRATLTGLDGRLRRIEDFHAQEALDSSHNRKRT